MRGVLKKAQVLLIRKRAAKAITQLYSGHLSQAEAEQVNPWYAEDTEYTKEFLETSHLLNDMQELCEDKDILAIMNVPNSDLHVNESPYSFRNLFSIAASLFLVLSLFFVIQKSYFSDSSDDKLLRYSTKIGEQKTITLSDNSIVTLNTSTVLLVDFNEQVRQLTLERGEAYFYVAKEPERRFSVSLGEHQVSALGTEFNIKREPEGFTVAVLEGVIALHQKDESIAKNLPILIKSEDNKEVTRDANQQTHLKAGWVAKVNDKHKIKGITSKDAVAKLDDWRDGVIDFKGEPLYKVIKELNRYVQRKILIEDDRIINLKIFAVFHVDDIDSALLGLTKVIPIKIQYQFDRVSLISSIE